MPTTAWTLPGADGQTIIGNTHLPENHPRNHHPDRPAAGVLIIAHGFKGYKDYGFFPHLASTAAARGLIAIRFNFSHSGMTNRLDTFARPDLFELDTWSKQVDDLLAVHAAVARGELVDKHLPIAWFGHSRGGLTTILAAARLFDASSQDTPAAVIPVSAPHRATTGFDEQVQQLIRSQGYVESPSARTGQALRVGAGWLAEIDRDPQAYDPVAAIARIACPILLIHGETDPTVPVEASRALATAAGDNAQLATIPDAGHTFNCPNPLPPDAEPPPETNAMVRQVCDFALTATRS